MTKEEFKAAAAAVSVNNGAGFDANEAIATKPKPFADGTYEVCPCDTYSTTNGTKMLAMVDDGGNVWGASLANIGGLFGKTEGDLQRMKEAGESIRIKCEVTLPDPQDVQTYNMLKAQGKSKEELEAAGFPFKPSSRRTFTKVA